MTKQDDLFGGARIATDAEMAAVRAFCAEPAKRSPWSGRGPEFYALRSMSLHEEERVRRGAKRRAGDRVARMDRVHRLGRILLTLRQQMTDAEDRRKRDALARRIARLTDMLEDEALA